MSQKANLSLIKQLALENKTVREIALETGYAEGTIRRHLKSMNITAYSKRAKITNEIIEKIIRLNKEGKTNKQISEIIKVNPVTVRLYLNKNNIESCSERIKTINKKDITLSDEQLEILYGSLLGDMSIGINWKNARPSITHGTGLEEYFDYKCGFFKNILGKICKTPRYDKRTNKYYDRYSVRFLSHPIFTEIYHLCYPNGIKTVTKKWLDKITPRGLAFWFMDDGTINGTLATNSFSYEEVTLIKNWFKEKYDIDVSIENQKSKKGILYLIYILSTSKPKFYKLVKPYIIPSMEYKFKNWNP